MPPPTAARSARALLLCAVAVAAAPAPAPGQDRPSEEELFGAPPPQGERPASRGDAPSTPPEEPHGEREAELFGSTGSPAAQAPPPERVVPREQDDPLRWGGQLYLRLQAFAQDGVDAADAPLASPNLLDVFLDVRPNERVRAFALGRLAYDGVEPAPRPAVPALAEGLVPAPASNPRAVLDQLWVNFDVARRAFVTAGRQHVKWGVGRFWTPTDFLHRQPRDPLDPFDARTGTAMVKVHLPWEARGWNAYAVALLEDPRVGAGEAAGTVRGVPAGGRLEVVLGTMELGADFLAGEGARPRFGLDVSAGVWEVDVYAEAALGAGRPRWRVRRPFADEVAEPGLGRYALEAPAGASPQVVVGGDWSARYSDEDVVTVGAEYFFQDDGYDDRAIYPFLALGAPASTAPLFLPGGGLDPDARLFRQDPAAFTAFHLGRHYAGAFVSLPAPGSWNDTTFTLSVLGNLSDRSFVARLDHSLLALTYLRVETFVAGHLGRRGGELRLGLDVPAAVGALGFAFPAPVVDVGVALRVSL